MAGAAQPHLLPNSNEKGISLCDGFLPSPGRKLNFTIDNGKIHNVSLGQGQEAVAERALEVAAAQGHWVILQVRGGHWGARQGTQPGTQPDAAQRVPGSPSLSIPIDTKVAPGMAGARGASAAALLHSPRPAALAITHSLRAQPVQWPGPGLSLVGAEAGAGRGLGAAALPAAGRHSTALSRGSGKGARR